MIFRGESIRILHYNHRARAVMKGFRGMIDKLSHFVFLCVFVNTESNEGLNFIYFQVSLLEFKFTASIIVCCKLYNLLQSSLDYILSLKSLETV